MTTVHERERASDSRFDPGVHYVYILRLRDDSLYVGQTNDLVSRVAEHSIDAGAEATKGQEPRLVWFSHTHDRTAAHQMEQRLQAALQRSPLELEAIIERFTALLDMVRPQKTFSQLREEEEAYESEMRRVFHYSTATMFNPGGLPATACGYRGTHYSTQDWEWLKKMARDEDFTGNVYGRKVCRRCLAVAPESQ